MSEEPWEVAYGYNGQEPQTLQCKNEEEAVAISREIQISFGTTSNWKISAHRKGHETPTQN